MPIVWMCSSRRASLLFSEYTLITNDAAVTVTLLPEPAKVALPVICEVRPTASSSAGRNASFSRTRYPACEPDVIVHWPASEDPELRAAACLAVLRRNGGGAEVGNRTK